jgi:hypothetical protein
MMSWAVALEVLAGFTPIGVVRCRVSSVDRRKSVAAERSEDRARPCPDALTRDHEGEESLTTRLVRCTPYGPWRAFFDSY